MSMCVDITPEKRTWDLLVQMGAILVRAVLTCVTKMKQILSSLHAHALTGKNQNNPTTGVELSLAALTFEYQTNALISEPLHFLHYHRMQKLSPNAEIEKCIENKYDTIQLLLG